MIFINKNLLQRPGFSNNSLGRNHFKMSFPFDKHSSITGRVTKNLIACSAGVEFYYLQAKDKNKLQKHILLVEGLLRANGILLKSNVEQIAKLYTNGIGVRGPGLNPSTRPTIVDIHYSIFNKSVKTVVYNCGVKISEATFPYRGVFKTEVISNYLNLITPDNGQSRVFNLVSLSYKTRDTDITSPNLDLSKSKSLYATLPQVTFQFKLLGLTKSGLSKVCASLKALLKGFNSNLDINIILKKEYTHTQKDFKSVKLSSEADSVFISKIESSSVRSVAFSLIKKLTDTTNRPAQINVYKIYVLLSTYLQYAEFLYNNIIEDAQVVENTVSKTDVQSTDQDSSLPKGRKKKGS